MAEMLSCSESPCIAPLWESVFYGAHKQLGRLLSSVPLENIHDPSESTRRMWIETAGHLPMLYPKNEVFEAGQEYTSDELELFAARSVGCENSSIINPARSTSLHSIQLFGILETA